MDQPRMLKLQGPTRGNDFISTHEAKKKKKRVSWEPSRAGAGRGGLPGRCWGHRGVWPKDSEEKIRSRGKICQPLSLPAPRLLLPWSKA